MGHYDDTLVSSGWLLNHSQNAVGERFGAIVQAFQSQVAALPEEDLLGLDAKAWSAERAAEMHVEPPTVDTSAASVAEEGMAQVDCQGIAGVSISTAEWGRAAIRDGNVLRVVVPAAGEVGLLASARPTGGPGVSADIVGDRIERRYTWPHVLGQDTLNADIDQFLAELDDGALRIADQVRARNVELAAKAQAMLETRRDKVSAARSFVGGLRLPLRSTGADQVRIPTLPKPTPVPRALTRPAVITGSAPPLLDEPTINQFYEHVVTVIRASARGFERTPGHLPSAEEGLRDHLLITLNTHYVGLVHGESFNAKGKTDILIRWADNNVFIGECKWWGGVKVLVDALQQLVGYTTWRDNRLALVLFVGTKALRPVIDTTRAALEAHALFGGWQDHSHEGELRCQLRWTDGEPRAAVLTTVFVFLPELKRG